jgi:hypothetical protein
MDENTAAYGNYHLKPDFRLCLMLISSQDRGKETGVPITNTNKEETQYLK